jgi:hypothetical protein|tara:strand:+ start:10331 stop:10780 length:450 start_codon:yes stop_codon:yes gene_type:complete
MSESIKSRYKPSNPQKYVGDVNNIICRSSWERRFCVWCDSNENILEWGSEEFWIPYRSPVDNRVHKYFPDFFIKVRERNGSIKKYVIEVKPHRQTQQPNPKPKRKTKSWLYEVKTYAVNQAKWKAATEFCADRLLEFKIITENELGIKR